MATWRPSPSLHSSTATRPPRVWIPGRWWRRRSNRMRPRRREMTPGTIRNLAKAASAAFLLLALFAGPAMAQEATERDRNFIAAAEKGDLAAVRKLRLEGVR